MQSSLNGSTVSAAARLPQKRSAVLIGIALVLALGAAGPSRSQAPGERGASGGEWAQCLKTATRACVLRYAATVADSIEDSRPQARLDTVSSRVEYLGLVAEAQFEAALATEAAATLERARELASSIAGERGGWGDSLLGRIVAILARAGKLDAAVEVARSIGNEIERSEAIGRVAAAKGEAGSIAVALELVQAIEDKPLRARMIRAVAWELRWVAVAQGEDGRIVAALRDVEAIEEEHPPPTKRFSTGLHHPSVHETALGIIATAQVRAGKIDEALQVARSIKDKADRAVTLASVGLELANGSQIRQALELARSIDDHAARGRLLDSMLEYDLEPHFTFLGWADVRRLNSGTKRTSGDQPGKVEGADEAVRIAMTLPAEQRSVGLGIVAVAHARAGDIKEALDVVPLIQHQRSRFVALLAIGKAQVKAGLPTQSIATFDQALQAALTFVPRDRYLAILAMAQATAGQISEALNVTTLIEDTKATAGDSVVMTGLGMSFGGDCNCVEVRRGREFTGKFISGDYNRRWALYEIARAQAKAGLITDAVRTARSLDLPAFKDQILGSGRGVVAEGLAEAGRIEEALSAAEAVENPYKRAGLLVSIAKSQAAAHRHAEALQIAQAVSNPQERIQALVAAAAAQAKAGLIADASATCHEALRVAVSLGYRGQIVSALVAIAGVLPN
jgi:tetratricopeptide (TPR) repeat protein